MMEPAMLDGIPQRACYWFLSGYFVKRLRAPLASDYLIGHLCFEQLIIELWFAVFPGPALETSSIS